MHLLYTVNIEFIWAITKKSEIVKLYLQMASLLVRSKHCISKSLFK